MELTVGSKIILLRDMMSEKVGSVGYVFEIYEDYDNHNKFGAQIIFQNGSYCGYSSEEQDLYLQFVENDPRFSSYVFRNVDKVHNDFRLGWWKFHDR